MHNVWITEVPRQWRVPKSSELRMPSKGEIRDDIGYTTHIIVDRKVLLSAIREAGGITGRKAKKFVNGMQRHGEDVLLPAWMCVVVQADLPVDAERPTQQEVRTRAIRWIHALAFWH